MFPIVHPRDFPARFGLAKVPSPATLKRWRKLGFPSSLEVPKGHYLVSEVQGWLRRQARARRSKAA